MSLINDALKRANQVKPPPLPPGTPGAPLHAADYNASSPWPWLVVLLVLAVVAGGGWFFFKSWHSQHATRLSAREASNETAAQQRTGTPGKDGGVLRSQLDKISASATVFSNAAARGLDFTATNALNAGTNVASGEGATPSFPAVRLQGIFYRPTRPSAMINAKTVFIGDKVAGTKVVRITRDNVTVEWNGETKVLTMDQ